MNRILIDTGYNGGRSCSGEQIAPSEHPAYRIGNYLDEILNRMGFDTLLSDRVPELGERGSGEGRPSVCAALARRWKADCLLRLCVRPSRLPCSGEVEAFANRRDANSLRLSRHLIEEVARGSMLRQGAVHASNGILLLRKTSCPASMLVLRIPFSQQERMTEQEAHGYAASIASGLGTFYGMQKKHV